MTARRAAHLAAIALTLGLLTAACGDDGRDLAYYETPGAKDTGEPGELLDAEPITLDGLTGEGHRVTYVSTTPADDIVHVTGVVIVPAGPAPPEGRPVALWGHPTEGVGTACAPSLTEPFALEGAQQLLDAGFVVAAPDYDGLGSEGVHPYLVVGSQGRSMLDMARAAREFGGNDTVVAWGHSQGGHAGLSARAVAEDYAPELDLRATAAAAPPTDLARFLDPGFEDPMILALTANAAFSWGTVYEVDLSPLATPEALSAARAVVESCFVELAAATSDADPSEVWARGPDEVPAWGDLTTTNSIDAAQGEGPVFLSHGDADIVVPVSGTQELADALCDEGETVVLRRTAEWDHNTAYSETRAELFDWLIAAAEGAELTSTC